MAKRRSGQITEKELAQLPELTRNKIIAAMQEQKTEEQKVEQKASIASDLKSAIIPKLESVSRLEKIQEGPSIEAAVGATAEGGKKGVLDNILNYSKISSDNTTQLVSLTQDIKALNEKSIEDNKELLERLLKSNEAIRTSMEEASREASRMVGGTRGTGVGAASGAGGGSGGGAGGGIPDWLKAAGGVAAAGLGAKMLGGAAKMVGPKAATKAMAGAKGFGKGALKAGGIGALGLLGYTMASDDIKEKLAEYGIDENTIAAAGVAGTLGYGAYKAKKGMEGVDEAVKQKRVENIEAQKDSGKQAERVKEAKEAAKEAKAQPKAEAPKVEPKVDPTKGAAEAAKDKLVKEAGETATEKAGKTVGKEAVKKALTKSAASKAVTTIAKKIPIIGALAGLAFAIPRAIAGDYTGAGLEATSGVIGGTGVGAVGSLAIDAGLMARDVYQQLYGVFPEDDEPDLRNDRIAEIQSEVTDYIKSLVPQTSEQSTSMLQPLDELSGPSTTPEQPNVQSSTAPKFRSGAADSISQQSETTASQVTPQLSQSARSEAISQSADQQGAKAPPIIVNKGGDTINNITNASGGGSGGAAGTPSRIPNPWDNQVFGNPWVAYP